MAATEKNKQTKVKWTGLGLWNVFFIGEFLLGGFGYLSLNLLLSFGPSVTVISPPELKAMVVSSLRDTLDNYGPDDI